MLRDYLVSAASQEWEEIPRRREAVRIGRATLTAQMKNRCLSEITIAASCVAGLTLKELTVDHIVAAERRGLKRRDSYLRALCGPCNSAKRVMTNQ